VQLASVDAVADLTAGQEFPIASWTDAYNDTVSNLQSLEAQMTADPHPILSAIDANMTEYANELSSAAQTSSSNLTNALQDLSSVLSNAWSDLQSGDVYDAETSIWQALLQDPTSVSRPFENAYFEIIQVDGEQPRQRAQPCGNLRPNSRIGRHEHICRSSMVQRS